MTQRQRANTVLRIQGSREPATAHHGAGHGGQHPAAGSGEARFHHADSTWQQILGKASESEKARSAYATLQKLVARYPPEAALRAAGFTTDPGENHYDVSSLKAWDDGQAHLA